MRIEGILLRLDRAALADIDKAGEALGENAAGAGGATGSLRGKNAKPDGYTIGFAHMGTHAAAVSTNSKLPYDPRTDFDYLGIHLVTPHLIIVRKDFPAQTLQEFIAYARAKGKDLKMGHNGAGSLAHLTCVFFFNLPAPSPPTSSIAASARPSTTRRVGSARSRSR